jgi:hypothetical protein
LSFKNNLYQSKNKIKNEIIPSPEVFPETQSVQLSALKIKTYHKIVKIRGII